MRNPCSPLQLVSSSLQYRPECAQMTTSTYTKTDLLFFGRAFAGTITTKSAIVLVFEILSAVTCSQKHVFLVSKPKLCARTYDGAFDILLPHWQSWSVKQHDEGKAVGIRLCFACFQESGVWLLYFSRLHTIPVIFVSIEVSILPTVMQAHIATTLVRGNGRLRVCVLGSRAELCCLQTPFVFPRNGHSFSKPSPSSTMFITCIQLVIFKPECTRMYA